MQYEIIYFLEKTVIFICYIFMQIRYQASLPAYGKVKVKFTLEQAMNAHRGLEV